MQKTSLVRLALAAFAGVPSLVGAYWVVNCAPPLVVERVDPIVSPGMLSVHVHDVLGGSAFASTMDYAATQASACTSCKISRDLSNYWFPTLYFHAENGSYIEVPRSGGGNIYYKQHWDPLDRDPDFNNTRVYPNGTSERFGHFYAFPEGFRMLAGDPLRRSYNPGAPAQRAIQWICISGANNPARAGIPRDVASRCIEGLQARVLFPSCWNGADSDSPDHRRHVAYPERVDSGRCPRGYPKRLPFILFEVTYNVDYFAEVTGMDKEQPFVLSNGDPTGYGMHGDFLNGWDVDLLYEAINDPDCNVSGDAEDCPPLAPFLDGAMDNCTAPPETDEPARGVLARLPGCNPIQAGPKNATLFECDAEGNVLGRSPVTAVTKTTGAVTTFPRVTRKKGKPTKTATRAPSTKACFPDSQSRVAACG